MIASELMSKFKSVKIKIWDANEETKDSLGQRGQMARVSSHALLTNIE
jgi:hypothetical protein